MSMRPDGMATMPHRQQDASADPSFGVTVLDGEAALAWLETAGIRDKFDALYRRCPWATRFQSWEFVTIWYRCYRETIEPVILYREDGGRLTGLFPLARELSTGRLAAAGDHQAEYQGWLAEEDIGDSFFEAALRTIKQRYRPDTLRLRYLPAKAPTGWIEQPLASGIVVSRRLHQRPLFSLCDPKAISDSLKKKGNKSRLNRLKRLGEVRLRHLETKTALEAVIDEITEGYDLRQGAANGVCPFTDDPLKRCFHLDLMAHPGLMQASVLTVGDRIAAAHLGIHDKGSVTVGVFGHAPALGQHSPGKFLMLMLAADLAAAGKRLIDLTPGGAWKDRFATDHDQVLEVTIFFTRSLARRHQAAETALAAARGSLALVGATPDDARRFAERLCKTPFFARHRAANQPAAERLIYYRASGEATADPADRIDVARNRTRDLLQVDPRDWRQSRQEFLAVCEQRLASGHVAYTHVENGRLYHVSWLTDSCPDDDLPTLPGRTAWLTGEASAAAGQDLHRRCTQAIVKDIADSVDQVAMILNADDTGVRQMAEALGFRRWQS